MLLALMLVFVAVPILEIALLIKVGNLIDFWPTLALVIATAVIGTAIMQRQGLKALMNAQNSMNKGEIPVESVVDGAFLLVAGAFLLTPGLITDSIGFLFLVPPFRRWFARWGFKRFMHRGAVRASVFTSEWEAGQTPDPRQQGSTRHGGSRGGSSTDGDGPIIDGEFERLDDKPDPPPRRR